MIEADAPGDVASNTAAVSRTSVFLTPANGHQDAFDRDDFDAVAYINEMFPTGSEPLMPNLHYVPICDTFAALDSSCGPPENRLRDSRMPKCAENSLSGIDPLIVSLKQKVRCSLSFCNCDFLTSQNSLNAEVSLLHSVSCTLSKVIRSCLGARRSERWILRFWWLCASRAALAAELGQQYLLESSRASFTVH